ncbi:FAD-dependent oxidoreductase [Aeromicrobium fastidiosum]|uniref:FAD-dependent oxidoreductase n=1 Tax=Aeromicrobium fastidiosum TaxID=52699 RepID=UPI0020237B46|nr:FAD-dependent oxidoreductase [Aeromicrobium fastidiosum]MCL8253159.1 FAD-dependent oxidoreductase [Aeromicrobium fastidiosum]
MTYVVTQACCADASCMSVCPVNCIHPAPGEPDFGHTEMVYVDPRSCIDCGACADACPVSAIKPLELLSGDEQVFGDINAAFYDDREAGVDWSQPSFPIVEEPRERPLRIAVVGTGPAASYTARELLTTSSAHVSMIDRLPVAGGLVRSGVAPDHPDTKRLADMFTWTYDHPRTRMYLNVDVGGDVSHADVLAHHDAVVYAVGARLDRALGVPGEHLPGVHGSPEVVGWYNSHTDVDASAIDVSTDRVVVVGNGNVALDVARILLGDVEALGRTDIADHALDALRSAPVREVVVLGRRGPEHAAFTRPELLMMPRGIDVAIEADGQVADELAAAAPGSKAASMAGLPLVDVDWSAPPPPGRRLVLAFHRTVDEVVGAERVEGVRLGRVGTDRTVDVRTGLVVRSTGHRGSPVAGMPFDEATATIPHTSGRVVDPATGLPVPGTYVVGWIKRGASGGIGANRTDAQETVATLLADARAHLLPTPPRPPSPRGFARLLRSRGLDVVGRRRMKRIDADERRRGEQAGRPRVKFATVDEMLEGRR